MTYTRAGRFITLTLAAAVWGCGGGSKSSDAGVMPSTALFASGSDWMAYDDDPGTNPAAHLLGPAQTVCLDASHPDDCPSDAVVYGFGAGWGLDRSTIPFALWIWGPGVSPTGAADLKKFFFSRTLQYTFPLDGKISVAADDFAEVFVNGESAGSIGSTTDLATAGTANTELTTFDLTDLLFPGSNVITVAAQNGPATFAGCPSACTYAQNPAGVVFGGTVVYR
jgi:hypothetical protein